MAQANEFFVKEGRQQPVVVERDNGATLELSGVRRIGRFTGEAATGALEAAIDDLVRYILGVDVEFERLLRRAG